MDVDMDDAEASNEDDEGEWMDVDGEEPPTSKRAKGNSGAVIAKNSRAPRTNRQLAGMRDDEVSKYLPLVNFDMMAYFDDLLASIQGRQATQLWSTRT